MQKKLIFLRGLLAILLLLPTTAMTQAPAIGDVITTHEGVTGIVFSVNGSGTNREVSIIELSDLGGGGTYTWMTGSTSVDAPNFFVLEATADTDQYGFMNSAMMRHAIALGATSAIWNAVSTTQKNNGWYLPSLGQMRTMYLNKTSINAGLSAAGGNEFAAEVYWTSTMANGSTSQWKINMNNGQRQSGSRSNTLRVRGCYDAYTEDGGTTWYLHHRNCPYGLPTEEDPHQECDSYEWINHMPYNESITALDDNKWPAMGSSGECMVYKLLVLDLGHSSHSKIQRVECDAYNWIPNGAYSANPILTSGTYYNTSTNADDCPQKDTLVLTINHTSTDDTTVNECDTYTWTAWKWNATVPAFQTGATYTTTPSPDPTMTWTNSDNCTHTRTLHLTIRQSEHPVTNAPHVCDTYTWTAEHGDGNTYTTPGIHTYYNEYTASNGCPSRAELNLTLFQSTHIATTTEICHGNTYTWNRTDGTSADYNANSPSVGVVYPYMNGDNCPSADTLHLTVWPIITQPLNIDACVSYIWNVYDGYGNLHPQGTKSATGTYNYTTTSSHGCDSNIVLNLTIHQPDADQVFNETACDSYTWPLGDGNGQTYITTTIGATHPHYNQYGCLSTNTLNVTVHYSTHNTTPAVECEENGYTWTTGDGNTYNTTGTYQYPYTNGDGCSSVDTLHLTINPTKYGTYTVSACDSYTWSTGNGNTYSTNNTTDTYTYPAPSSGCDSIVTLNLTINHANASSDAEFRCSPYNWTVANYDGSGSHTVATITANGNYQATVQNHKGCDSVITMNFTVGQSSDSTLNVMACGNYTWIVADYNGSNPTTRSFGASTSTSIVKRNYLNCDSTITLILTVNNNTASTFTHSACTGYQWRYCNYNDPQSERSRSYTISDYDDTVHVRNAAGCDSIILLNLTIYPHINGDTHIVNCGPYEWHVHDANGTDHLVDIYSESGTWAKPAQVSLTDRHGCDSSVTLHLTIVDPHTYGIHVDTACPGTIFTWNVADHDGSNPRVVGYYTVNNNSAQALHLRDHNGCDSTVTLNLTFRNPNIYTYTVDSCEHFTWTPANWDGSNPLAPITHSVSYTGAYPPVRDHYGCDSTITLNLTIHHSNTFTLDTSVCSSFRWEVSNGDGSGQRTIGTYSPAIGTHNSIASTHVLTNYGCDSTITLNLTVHGTTISTVDTFTCESLFNWYVRDYNPSASERLIRSYIQSTNEPIPAVVTDHNGCDSTIYLNLRMGSPNNYTYPMTVCDTLIWTVANADGSNPHIIDTFTYNGSNTHTATVSNASGCDSVITLNLTINKSSSGILNRTECNNYSWTVTDYGGLNPSTISLGRDTNITIIKRNQYGCDSTITLNLTVNSNTSFTLDTHACSNFQWKVRNYNDPGNRDRLRGTYTGSIYTDTAHVRNAVGCDSTILLHLTIYPLQHGDTHVVSCGPYLWYVHDGDGTDHLVDIYSESGTWAKPANVPLTDIYGCDSNVTLYLTVVDAHTYGTDNQLACPGYTYTWRVANYDGTNRRTVGYYTTNNNTAQATVIDHNGCDSTVTLNLTLRTPNISTYSVDACERFVWVPCNWDGSDPRDARTYTASNNTAQAQVIDQYGCDSVITLNLTIHHRTYSTLDTTVCTSFTWIVSDADGSNQSTIGTYVPAAGTYNNYAHATVLTNYGCDSTITLNLTVRGTTHYTLDTTTCASSFTWQVGDYGSRLPSRTINTYYGSINNPNPAIVRDHRGCDSAIFLNLHMYTADSTHDTNITCNDFMWTVSDTWGNSPSNYRTDAGSIIPSNRPFESSRNDITATVKNIHGCDSVIRLILIKHDESRNDVFFDTCTGFTWTVIAPNGTIHTHEHSPYTISSNGVDQIRMTGANVYGCDSVVTLHLTIHNAQAPHHLYDTACYNYTWRISDYNGQRSTTVGTFYTDREADTARGLIDRYGCDSTVVLHLVIRDTLYGQLDTAVCQSTGFLWYASDADGTTRQIRGPQSVRQLGGLYTTTCFGDTARLRSTTGCDSVVTLNLSVYTGTTNNYDTVHTCGEPFRWQVYDHGGNVNRATATVPVLYQTSHNIYNVTVKDMHGCDSTVYLDLYVHNSATSYVETIDACYSYLWYATNSDGTIRGSYGPYTHSVLTTSVTLKDQYNCDSIVQLQINIHDSSTSVYRVDTCGSYTWRVQNYDGTGSRTVGTFTIANLTEGNDYIEHPAYHLTSSHGCDSTSTLQLYLHNPTAGRMDISSCTAYTWRVHNWDGSHEQVMGPYTTNQQGQPSARVLSQYGCDSIVRLYLNIVEKVRDTIDTAACANLTYTSSQGRQYTFNHSEVRAVDTLLAASGCDSIVTLNVTINVPSTVYQTEYACDSFVWPVDRVTYRHSTTAVGMAPDANGCNSLHELTLYIRNSTHVIDTHDVCRPYKWINNITYPVTTPASSGVTHTIHHSYAEGCDSVLTLDLHMRNIHDTVRKDTTVCDLFSWRNHSYSTSGVYTENFTPIAGCDSVVIYTVTVHRNSALTIYDTACDTYTWMVDSLAGGHRAVGTYTTSDPALTAVIPNAIGCDSTITLNLRIYHRDSSIVYDTVCDSLWWIDGRRYITSTSPNNPIYYTLHNNRYGCDSTIALHLTVKYSSTPYRIVNQTVCDRYDWIVNHDTINTYYATDNQIVTRIHDTIHTLNMASCDSTIWLALQIRRSSERHDTVANCYSYTWSTASGGNNGTYSTSGTYRDTLLRNRVGCDSIGILHLTINGDSAGTQDTIACSYFTFTDQAGTHLTYNDSTFTTHLRTVAGCDSTLTLNVMVINPHPGNETLTVCDSLIWHGTTYHTSTPRAVSPTLHDQYGCDSNSYLNLTVNYSVSSTINVTSCDQYYWGPSQTNYTRDTIARRTYPRTTNQGCDSTVELHLTILPSRTETAYDTTVCDTMYWNGRIYTTDGPYVQQLHTVRGNCDSIVTLNVTVKHASSATLTDTACDSYTWSVAHYNSGRRPFTVGTYITSGIYDTVVRNAMGCDSTITLQLTVFNRNSGILYDTACARYMWLGEYRNNSGIYRDTIETIHGCDSAVTLFLAIIPADTIRIPATACDTFTWRGTTYNTDTVVDDSYTNRFDCDSTIQLILTVHHRNTGDTSVSACDSYRWINDSTYKASSTDHFTIDRGNQYGCDSTITLHLSVSRSSMSAERQDVCDTFVWVNGDGNTYTQSDSIEYVMRGANVSGCDSTIKLFLTVRNSSVTVDNQVAYRSFTWVDSVTYTENTTTPRFNLGIPNAEGCDSVLELHLTLSPYPAPIINNIADLAVVVNHHPNGTAEYIDYIDYRWYCNDSLVSEGSDVYSSDRPLQGAFYVEIPTSYARSTWFRSNTIYLNVSSIDGVEMSTTMELKAVPNPVSTQGILHVTTSLNPDECKNAMLYLYDLQGRLLTSVRPDGSQTDIPVNTSAGFYTLHLITNDGRHVASKIVVR